MDSIDEIEVDGLFKVDISYTGSIFFILGLIWSYKMVEKTFVDILIARASKVYDLPNAALLVNSQEVIAVVFIVAFAYATEIYRGRLSRYLMVVFSTTASIAGMILSFLVGGNDDKRQLDLWLSYPALVLMAFAQAAQTVTLKAFLHDQFRLVVDSDVDQRREYTKFWWTLVSLVAALLAYLEPLIGFHFEKLALALIIVMVFFFIVFLSGFRYYYKDGERDRYYLSTSAPRRWSITTFPLLLWVCLLILNLVSASGSTFFLLEARTQAGHDNLFAILILANVVRVTEFLFSELSSRAITKLTTPRGFDEVYERKNSDLVRIGIGMLCCVMCCNAAVWTATCRKYGTGDMSVYWLIPQFILLGIMGGLAKAGFQSFVGSNYAASLVELARGLGSLLSIFFNLIISRGYLIWFQNDIDNSSLNNYYNFLESVSIFNLGLYLVVFFRYTGDAFLDTEIKPHNE